MLMFENIGISNLTKMKNNSEHLMGYLDEVTRPLVFVLPKVSRYVKTFKVKDGDKDKNNKLISFHKNQKYKKKVEKYKTIWTKNENLKNIKLNVLAVFDDRYLKTKIKTYGDKVYANFPV